MITEVRTDYRVEIRVDDVLRAQGADPLVVRDRRPRLVGIARDGIEEARDLIEPAAVTTTLGVDRILHNRVVLEGGHRLTGTLAARHLAAAEELTFVACTIGPRLPGRAAEVVASDPVRGLALDAAGSAAITRLGAAVCKTAEARAAERDLAVSVPLSPGLDGWPVEVGQPEIFALVDPDSIGVEVTSTLQMIPIKSITMVLGIGPSFDSTGEMCDYCGVRETCRHRTRA